MDELDIAFDPGIRYDLTNFLTFMHAQMGLMLLKPMNPTKNIQTNEIKTQEKGTQTEKQQSVLWSYFT